MEPKPVGTKKSESDSTLKLVRIFAVFTLIISFVFRPDSLPQINLCLFYAITGLQCPGCGMTRAFCSISHGQFANAWRLNPFSFILYALTVMCLLYPSTINHLSEKIAIVFVLTAALTIFGVFRMLISVGLI